MSRRLKAGCGPALALRACAQAGARWRPVERGQMVGHAGGLLREREQMAGYSQNVMEHHRKLRETFEECHFNIIEN